MFKCIRKIVRKVWDNTCFATWNVMKNITEGRLLVAILIPGLVLASFHYMYQDKSINYDKNLRKALIQGWQYNDNGEIYLNVYIETDSFPLVWGKEEIVEITARELNLHNYQVRARRSNRSIGLYVKPNARLEKRVEAIYSENIEVNGVTQPIIWLMSDNVIIEDPDLAKDLQEKGEKLSLRE